jgi:hypothetical protein
LHGRRTSYKPAPRFRNRRRELPHGLACPELIDSFSFLGAIMFLPSV